MCLRFSELYKSPLGCKGSSCGNTPRVPRMSFSPPCFVPHTLGHRFPVPLLRWMILAATRSPFRTAESLKLPSLVLSFGSFSSFRSCVQQIRLHSSTSQQDADPRHSLDTSLSLLADIRVEFITHFCEPSSSLELWDEIQAFSVQYSVLCLDRRL